MPYDNNSVRLNAPVQYGIYDGRDGVTDWYDCVVSEDGQSIFHGIDGSGSQFPIDTFRLRNTPMIGSKAIEQWYKDARLKLEQERAKLHQESETRMKNVRFVYKSKTQLKKEKGL